MSALMILPDLVNSMLFLWIPPVLLAELCSCCGQVQRGNGEGDGNRILRLTCGEGRGELAVRNTQRCQVAVAGQGRCNGGLITGGPGAGILGAIGKGNTLGLDGDRSTCCHIGINLKGGRKYSGRIKYAGCAVFL